MSSPFDNYDKLITELQDSERLLVLGQEQWKKILSEAGKSLGQDAEGLSREETIASHRLHRKMSLVFGVAILESMVKDYFQYLADRTDICKMTDSATIPNFSDQCVSGISESEKKDLPQKSWEHRLDQWAQKKREEISKGTATGKQWLAAVRQVKGYCIVFAHWPVLLKSVVIRNLEMHNGGVMNVETHKHTPLCAIGEKLDWSQDNKLVYGLWLSLHLLNEGLNQLM